MHKSPFDINENSMSHNLCLCEILRFDWGIIKDPYFLIVFSKHDLIDLMIYRNEGFVLVDGN